MKNNKVNNIINKIQILITIKMIFKNNFKMKKVAVQKFQYINNINKNNSHNKKKNSKYNKKINNSNYIKRYNQKQNFQKHQ